MEEEWTNRNYFNDNYTLCKMIAIYELIDIFFHFVRTFVGNAIECTDAVAGDESDAAFQRRAGTLVEFSFVWQDTCFCR